jgi:hypothetical protein
MKRLAAVVVVCAAAFAGACSKGGGGSPAAPSPQVTSITVSGPDLVFLGRTGSYTAAMTGGSAGCSWGGDAPHIGTMTAGGQLSGLGNGRVTIWCDAAGARGTKLVQVAATYGGTWIGSYRVTGCSERGDLAEVEICADFQNNRVLPLSGSFTQSNLNATGAFALGQITAPPGSASVGADGTMTISLTHEGTGVITIRSEWRVRQDQDGRITGGVTITFTALGLVGSAVVEAEVFNTNRTSSSSSSSSSLTASAAAPAPIATIEDLLRAMRH